MSPERDQSPRLATLGAIHNPENKNRACADVYEEMRTPHPRSNGSWTHRGHELYRPRAVA